MEDEENTLRFKCRCGSLKFAVRYFEDSSTVIISCDRCNKIALKIPPILPLQAPNFTSNVIGGRQVCVTEEHGAK